MWEILEVYKINDISHWLVQIWLKWPFYCWKFKWIWQKMNIEIIKKHRGIMNETWNQIKHVVN